MPIGQAGDVQRTTRRDRTWASAVFEVTHRQRTTMLFATVLLTIPILLPLLCASGALAAETPGQAQEVETAPLMAGAPPVTAFSSRVAQDLRDIYLTLPSVNENAAASVAALTLIAYWNDETIYNALRTIDTPPLQEAARQVETFAGPITDLAVAGAIALKDPETGYLAANAIIYAGIATEILKVTFGVTRPRAQAGHEPHPFRYFEDGIHDSMPSGHTSTAFALARVLAERYPKYRLAFYAGAAAVGLSRIYAGAHWPSDVIAGAAVGIWSADQVLGRSRLFRWEW